MKRLPDSELELMMIIWRAEEPVTRAEIEKELNEKRKLSPTAILSFLFLYSISTFAEHNHILHLLNINVKVCSN